MVVVMDLEIHVNNLLVIHLRYSDYGLQTLLG
jgi:hypothetical protein